MFTLPVLPPETGLAAPVKSALDATDPVIASQFGALSSSIQQVAYIQRLALRCNSYLSAFACSASGGSTHAAGSKG